MIRNFFNKYYQRRSRSSMDAPCKECGGSKYTTKLHPYDPNLDKRVRCSRCKSDSGDIEQYELELNGDNDGQKRRY